jgi:hypothetical protein
MLQGTEARYRCLVRSLDPGRQTMVSSSKSIAAGFVGQTRVGFVMAAIVGFTGCAPHAYTQVESADALETASVVETEAQPIYIVIQPGETATQAPVIVKQEVPVVVKQPAPTNSGWTPDALPARNPFDRFKTWVGDYDCTQGNTDFTLRIMDVRNNRIRAVFDFTHDESGAKGSYVITGEFDPDTRRVHFEPTSWIDQPDHYLMVPMTGDVSTDDSLFAGKIDFRGCGAFRLKPTR